MILSILFLICFLPLASFADVETTQLKHSVSVQLGINGAAGKKGSFGLQAIPPDLSYSYKLFDNNRYVFSTSFFYDNISVQLENMNFNYRFGQRVDLGYEMKDTLLYGTFGMGYMVMQKLSNSTSPVYGFGIVRDITTHLAIMSELNFQNIKSQTIINYSIGVIYSFDL